MSSSSSTDRTRSVAAKLEQAIAVLARETPSLQSELARRLDACLVRISVDDETFDVGARHGVTRVLSPAGDADVTIETSRALVRSVLAGDRSLADALRDDALVARGSLRDLVTVLAALDAFVHGAVRCREMPELFEEFQEVA